MTLNSPVLMPLWWIMAAIVGLLLVTAWLGWVFVSTARDTSSRVGDIPLAPGDRTRWLGCVQDAAAAYEAGELSVRDLHLELAAVLRGFATQRTGTPMESLTVAEILDLAQGADRRSVIDRIRFLRSRRRPVDRNPLGYVGELLTVWEQPSFDTVTRADALEAVHETTEVVTRW